jgi:GMP synthase (glutamine-hydrolysing)
MTKPFLLLQSRPEKIVADNEYEAFLGYTGLAPELLKRLDISSGHIPDIKLTGLSGIMVGGTPYTYTPHPDRAKRKNKTASQLRFEEEMPKFINRVVSEDFPFLSACAVAPIVLSQGGTISRKYGEPVGATQIHLTSKGKKDKITLDVDEDFKAFAGHLEACDDLPSNAVLLATSETCPVQMFRIKNNVYATQFHSELDAHGLAVRIDAYSHVGYFEPEEAASLKSDALKHSVNEPVKILRNFVKTYQS